MKLGIHNLNKMYMCKTHFCTHYRFIFSLEHYSSVNPNTLFQNVEQINKYLFPLILTLLLFLWQNSAGILVTFCVMLKMETKYQEIVCCYGRRKLEIVILLWTQDGPMQSDDPTLFQISMCQLITPEKMWVNWLLWYDQSVLIKNFSFTLYHGIYLYFTVRL